MYSGELWALDFDDDGPKGKSGKNAIVMEIEFLRITVRRGKSEGAVGKRRRLGRRL